MGHKLRCAIILAFVALLTLVNRNKQGNGKSEERDETKEGRDEETEGDATKASYEMTPCESTPDYECMTISTPAAGFVDEIHEFKPAQEIVSSSRIIYNRIPKCGSTSVIQVLQKVLPQNHVRYLHSEVYGTSDLSSAEEAALVHTLQGKRTPWIYNRHFRMLNFTAYGYEMPRLINVFREPADRHRSHYYKDEFHKTNVSFDDCVAAGTDVCIKSFNYIRYFCTHGELCDNPNRTTLETAKRNLVRYYDVVGYAEDLDGFFQLVEHHFPEEFKGTYAEYQQLERFNTGSRKKEHLVIKNSTMEVLRERLWAEYELYDFIKQRFHEAMVRAGLRS